MEECNQAEVKLEAEDDIHTLLNVSAANEDFAVKEEPFEFDMASVRAQSPRLADVLQFIEDIFHAEDAKSGRDIRKAYTAKLRSEYVSLLVPDSNSQSSREMTPGVLADENRSRTEEYPGRINEGVNMFIDGKDENQNSSGNESYAAYSPLPSSLSYLYEDELWDEETAYEYIQRYSQDHPTAVEQVHELEQQAEVDHPRAELQLSGSKRKATEPDDMGRIQSRNDGNDMTAEPILPENKKRKSSNLLRNEAHDTEAEAQIDADTQNYIRHRQRITEEPREEQQQDDNRNVREEARSRGPGRSTLTLDLLEETTNIMNDWNHNAALNVQTGSKRKKTKPSYLFDDEPSDVEEEVAYLHVEICRHTTGHQNIRTGTASGDAEGSINYSEERNVTNIYRPSTPAVKKAKPSYLFEDELSDVEEDVAYLHVEVYRQPRELTSEEQQGHESNRSLDVNSLRVEAPIGNAERRIHNVISPRPPVKKAKPSYLFEGESSDTEEEVSYLHVQTSTQSQLQNPQRRGSDANNSRTHPRATSLEGGGAWATRVNYTQGVKRFGSRRFWTLEEINALESGLLQYGHRWAHIKQNRMELRNRTPMQIRDRARTEVRKRLQAGQDLGPYTICRSVV